jgi:hypothetical protein
LSDKARAVGANAPQRRMNDAVDHRVCRGTRIAATKASVHRMRSFAHASMCFAREIQGTTQPARSLARSPSSASSSGV